MANFMVHGNLYVHMISLLGLLSLSLSLFFFFFLVFSFLLNTIAKPLK